MPDKEILIANSGEGVAAALRQTTADKAHQIGQAMWQRALHEHTYELRVQEVHKVFLELFSARSQATNPKLFSTSPLSVLRA